MLTPGNVFRTRPANRRLCTAAAILTATFALAGCAALQPPSTGGPAENVARYPLLLTEDSHRKEAITVALNRLTLQPGTSDSRLAQLQPITGTILDFSPAAGRNLYLPKLGASAVMSEEEIRESLRRFIKEWQELIGADPAKLSLVARVDQPDGAKLASYEQRPFRYPIRGNYGKLQIRFTADRRLLNVTSTCIPDAERIQTALAALTVRVKAADAIQGSQLKLNLPANARVNPRGLVTYILPAKDRPDALEFHLAWELELENGPVSLAYIDAISGNLIFAQ
jgi:hypothetical protein